MNTSKTKDVKAKANEAKKKVQETIGKTDEKLHKHVEKLQNSTVGKLLPTEYEKLTTTKVAQLSLIGTFIANVAVFAFCTALTDVKEGVNVFPGNFTGKPMIAFMILSTLHDLYTVVTQCGSMLLSCVALRFITFIFTVLSILSLSGATATGLFKLLILASYFIAVMAMTYLFSVFILNAKKQLAAGNPGDHAAV